VTAEIHHVRPRPPRHHASLDLGLVIAAQHLKNCASAPTQSGQNRRGLAALAQRRRAAACTSPQHAGLERWLRKAQTEGASHDLHAGGKPGQLVAAAWLRRRRQ
jgi:hypothetical protein